MPGGTLNTSDTQTSTTSALLEAAEFVEVTKLLHSDTMRLPSLSIEAPCGELRMPAAVHYPGQLRRDSRMQGRVTV